MEAENITGQVAGLTDLVDYQTGSIVSRTLVDKSTGTLTLFAFDKGQGLSEHTAPFDAMVYVFEAKPRSPSPGDLFW
jgi:quercetin dioxygenase-like cupin family protein